MSVIYACVFHFSRFVDWAEQKKIPSFSFNHIGLPFDAFPEANLKAVIPVTQWVFSPEDAEESTSQPCLYRVSPPLYGVVIRRGAVNASKTRILCRVLYEWSPKSRLNYFPANDSESYLMVALYDWSVRSISQYVVCMCLLSFEKSRGWYHAVPYSAPFSGLVTDVGCVTSGGKMYGRRFHWSQTVKFHRTLHFWFSINQPSFLLGRYPGRHFNKLWVDPLVFYSNIGACSSRFQHGPSKWFPSPSSGTHHARPTSPSYISNSLLQDCADERHFLRHPSLHRAIHRQITYLVAISFACTWAALIIRLSYVISTVFGRQDGTPLAT